MDTRFVKINDGSNAELNAPASTASQSDEGVILEFVLDGLRYNKVAEGDRERLIFDVAGVIVSAQRMTKALVSRPMSIQQDRA